MKIYPRYFKPFLYLTWMIDHIRLLKIKGVFSNLQISTSTQQTLFTIKTDVPMQVVNRKERTSALWRFVGGYLLLFAVTAGLMLNSFSFREVDDKETRQVVEKMKKREEAQAQLAQLASMLNELQGIKKPYAEMPPEQAARYDRLRFEFEKGIEAMKRMYYGDTTQYNPNFQLASFLERNYREYNKISAAFQKQVEDKVKEAVAKIPPPSSGGGGGGNSAELMVLQTKLQAAQTQISDLRVQVANAAATSRQFQQMKEKAIMVESNIDQLIGQLDEIETECNGIQKKGDRNLEIKRRIITKINLMKSQASNLRNTNSSLVGL